VLVEDLRLLAVRYGNDALRAARADRGHQAVQHAVRALRFKAVDEVREVVDDEDAVLRVFEVIDDLQEVLVDLRRVVGGEQAFAVEAEEAAFNDVLRDIGFAAPFFDAVDQRRFADTRRAG
jgi:hypothetical protein